MEPMAGRDRCAGIDIGKADMKVCVRTPGKRAGSRHSEVRTFATTTRGVLAARAWLEECQVTVVGMESTGVYWKPVYYLLEEAVECQLFNARHLKKVPGRKSDVTDSQWIAQLVEYGLVRPSFVPPPPIRRLRDLTRYRTSVVREHTREGQRLQDVLEDAGIKLGCVASDVLGVSGRAMIEALIAGERDPEVLAELAKARLRNKLPALKEALVSRFSPHHAVLCRLMLSRLHQAEETISMLDAAIESEIEPFRRIRDHVDTIPGIGRRGAEIFIAETGGDMSRFPTPQDLASWAGMCPGNNESAGKHFSGRTRKGDVWLRAMLGEAAASAARGKHTYLAARYKRLAHRRGKKRALVALGHSMLIAGWYIITNDTDYADLGADYYQTRAGDPTRRAQRLLRELQDLGYPVTVGEPTPTAA